MARRDLSKRDASSFAASQLDYIIRSEKQEEEDAHTLSAEEAMREEQIIKASAERDVTRVLFISRNTALLNPTHQSLDGYVNLSDLFDEVHVLILRQGIQARYPALRVGDNVWLYTATSDIWWQTPRAGIDMVESQLEFANGFRPDLIVARDPFESAIVASKLGEKYGRPTQLHILDDYGADDFISRSPHNFWRLFLPHFTVPRFPSVRTLTETMQKKLEEKFDIPDLDTLPRYQNYKALIDIEPSIDLKEKYKPFIFIMLFVGRLDQESTLHKAIDAASFVLKNSRVGLIVLGDGPDRGEFQKKAKTLGIERQVVFEPRVEDIVPYLKSANLMLVTDTNTESEEVVLKAAAAGIPMVMTKTEKREDIFKHGKSAFLCAVNDTESFTEHIDIMLNDIELRKRFVRQGQRLIRGKFHDDERAYRKAYRASIEQALFVDPEIEAEDPETETSA